MRVTNNMLSNNMLKNLEKSNLRMALIHNQISTGQSITKPSDNPVGIETALRIKSTVSSMEQWKKNSSEALAYMESTESILGNMTSMLHRIRELAVKGADGSNSADDRSQIAKEIDQLALQFQIAANSQVNGKYIFSGTKIDQAPLDNYSSTRTVVNRTFDENGTGISSIADEDLGTGLEAGASYRINIVLNADLVNYDITLEKINPAGPSTIIGTSTVPPATSGEIIVGNTATGETINVNYPALGPANIGSTSDFEISDAPPAVPTSWYGNNKIMEFEVGPNLTIPISIGGVDLFEVDGVSQESDLFGTLNTLSKALYGHYPDSDQKIQESLGKLDSHLDNLLKLRSELGARTNRMYVITDQLDNSINISKKNLSDIQDVDMAGAIMEFKSVENVFKAALSVGAQIIQPSLIDFMR